MTYTKTKPTVPGYYWMRSRHFHESVVQIAPGPSRDRKLVAWLSGWECPEKFMPDMEFAGPLVSPGVAAERNNCE